MVTNGQFCAKMVVKQGVKKNASHGCTISHHWPKTASNSFEISHRGASTRRMAHVRSIAHSQDRRRMCTIWPTKPHCTCQSARQVHRHGLQNNILCSPIGPNDNISSNTGARLLHRPATISQVRRKMCTEPVVCNTGGGRYLQHWKWLVR